MRYYWRLILAMAMSAILLSSLLNILVDPYAGFPGVHLGAMDDLRLNKTRTAKAERIRSGGWDSMVFGTSIANQACDPRDPAWQGDRVFVGGLAGANFLEVAAAVDFALRVAPPKRIVLFLDLGMVSGWRDKWADFGRSRFNPDLRQTEYHLRHAISLSSTLDSLSVTRSFLSDKGGPRQRADGFRAREASVRVSWEDFVRVLGGYLHEEYNLFQYAPDRLVLLEHVLARCQSRGVKVHVVVPPFHAVALETIHRMGLWAQYERFLQDAAEVVDRSSRLAPEDVSPTLWDFTGYDGPRSEEVPLDGPGRMEWYSDPIHCTARFGSAILGSVLQSSDSTGGNGAPTGVRLHPSEVSAHLERIELQRAEWLKDHQEVVRRLESMISRSLPERQLRRRIAGLEVNEVQ